LHDHPVDDLCLAISFGVEGHGPSELGIQQRQSFDQNALRNILSLSKIMDCGIPKCTHTRSEKSFPVAFVMILVVGCQNGHLKESVDDHEGIAISMLGIRKA